MKVLSFGHIPSWAGGRQNQGLANVIYNLALNISRLDDVKVYLGATDVFTPQINREKLTILGWNKSNLLLYSALHPVVSLRYIFYLMMIKNKASHIVSVIGQFFKGMHLHRCICKTSPDVVHLHGCLSSLYLPLISNQNKVIVTIHGTVGNDSEIKNNLEYRYFENQLCHSSKLSCLCFIANVLKKEFFESYNGIDCQTAVILNAYNSDSFYYIQPAIHTGIKLLTIASIQPRKGQYRVLEALSKINDDIEYDCIGLADDDELQRLNSYCYHYTYHGKKTPNEIRNILSTMDYMILPSSSEGFGLVYLEAIACGVPVILPKQLPIVQESEIIQPGVNALLLEDSSSESIANLLPKLKEYNFDHHKVAKSIIGYSWENISKEYYNLYKSIL